MGDDQDQADFKVLQDYFGPIAFTDEGHRRFQGDVLFEDVQPLSGVRCSRFEQARIEVHGRHLFLHCDFQGGLIRGNPRGELRNCTFTKVKLSATFSEAFQSCAFAGVAFSGTFSKGFQNCTFERCTFGHETFFPEEARMENATGLETCKGLDLVECRAPYLLDRDLKAANLAWWCWWPSTWACLRGVGSLPFFGLSYAGVPLLLVMLAGIDFYNRQATALATANSGLPLHRIAIPIETVMLLISGIALMGASTIYALACPARIKEFSLQRWTEEFGKQSVNYLPLSWSKPWWRWSALVLYGIGGASALYVLSSRLVAAVGQLARNMG
ncbi:hypothetical protein KPL78_06480 [Roseomonas sp. HJA6]|uniref:Pentapeptide repeat-containing protein n=1 Tax=Roseomonas alba TaxID=2846776 RepID=A0ABS7A5A9_9PROT|nr:hypothetical protein [Neoroseomonas alba]MBW6397484.1 hypothetical protein [Neoroseomonas alba]